MINQVGNPGYNVSHYEAYMFFSMFTCEDASDFDVCARGDVAKEKHTGDHWRENYVYHVVSLTPSREWFRPTSSTSHFVYSHFVYS